MSVLTQPNLEIPDANEPFFVRCDGGLGNKIKCVLSALRLTSRPAIAWTRNVHFQEGFNDLFQNDWNVAQVPEDANVFSTWQFLILPGDPGAESLRGIHSAILIKKGAFVDYLYDEMPAAVRDVYVEKIRLLELHPAVEAVSRCAMERMPPNTVSVHIRSWYDSPIRRWAFEFKKFRRAMQRFPDASFFVCADSPVVVRKVKRAFPERVFTLDDLAPEAAGLRKGQIALVEMIVLGAASDMIVTDGSSFTEVSWLFGGGKAKVVTVSPSQLRARIYRGLLYLRKRIHRPLWLQRLTTQRTER